MKSPKPWLSGCSEIMFGLRYPFLKIFLRSDLGTPGPLFVMDMRIFFEMSMVTVDFGSAYIIALSSTIRRTCPNLSESIFARIFLGVFEVNLILICLSSAAIFFFFKISSKTFRRSFSSKNSMDELLPLSMRETASRSEIRCSIRSLPEEMSRRNSFCCGLRSPTSSRRSNSEYQMIAVRGVLSL